MWNGSALSFAETATSTISFDLGADVPADRIVAALTDFSDQRPRLFANPDPRFYPVHALGDTWAEVTEGSAFAGRVREPVRYDWPRSHTVCIQVLEGNRLALVASCSIRSSRHGAFRCPSARRSRSRSTAGAS